MAGGDKGAKSRTSSTCTEPQAHVTFEGIKTLLNQTWDDIIGETHTQVGEVENCVTFEYACDAEIEELKQKETIKRLKEKCYNWENTHGQSFPCCLRQIPMNELLEILLLRLACCSFPVVLLYSFSHKDDTITTVCVPVLYSLTLSTITLRRCGRAMYRYCIPINLLFAYFYSNYFWCGTLVHVIHPDVLLASSYPIQLWRHVQSELYTIFGFLTHYCVKFIRLYGGSRLLFFFTACCVHTFLVVFLFSSVYDFASRITYNQINAEGWFGKYIVQSSFDGFSAPQSYPLKPLTQYDKMYTEEHDTYILYGRSLGHDFQPSSNIIVSRCNKSYIETLYSRIDYYDNLAYVHETHFDGIEAYPQVLPLCRVEHFRYVGEDVRFKCSFQLNSLYRIFGAYLLESGVFWLHKGRRIKSSDRFYFNLSPGEYDVGLNDSYIHLKGEHVLSENFDASLDVNFVENEDFGEYMLYAEVVCSYFAPSTINDEKWHISYHRTKLLIGQFILSKLKAPVEYIRVPVGRMIHLRSIRYISFADESDLSVFHKIESLASNESKDTDSLCPSLFRGCSLFTSVYFSLIPESAVFRNINEIIFRKFFDSEFIIDVMSCVCANNYGEHTLVIHREFYNRTSERKEMFEIQHPLKFVVLPMESLFSTQNYSSELYMETADMFEENPTSWRNNWKHFIPGEETVYRNKLWIEHALFLLFLSEMIMVMMLVARVYSILFIVPLRKILLEGTLFSRIQPITQFEPDNLCDVEFLDNETKYDVMVVHSDEDNEFVNDILVPSIEHMELNVCIPERDFSPGRSNISSYSEAVSLSRKFIVICSHYLLKNKLLNKFVCSDLIFTKVLYQESHENRILFLKYGECEIPRPLSSYEIIDWTTSLQSEDKLRKLRRWLMESIW